MVQDNSTIIVKRALGGLFIWFLAASISCGVSASIVNYFAKKALAGNSMYGILINVFLVLFGIVWLIISVVILYNILRILRRHALLPPSNVRIRKLDEEKVIQFIKDVISFYRGYRWDIVVVGGLSIIVGIIVVTLSVNEYVIGAISVSELVFKLVIATILLTYGILDLYLEKRSICRRLAKVKQLEDVLSKFIE